MRPKWYSLCSISSNSTENKIFINQSKTCLYQNQPRGNGSYSFNRLQPVDVVYNRLQFSDSKYSCHKWSKYRYYEFHDHLEREKVLIVPQFLYSRYLNHTYTLVVSLLIASQHSIKEITSNYLWIVVTWTHL
jgi:hypothetical protein